MWIKRENGELVNLGVAQTICYILEHHNPDIYTLYACYSNKEKRAIYTGSEKVCEFVHAHIENGIKNRISLLDLSKSKLSELGESESDETENERGDSQGA